VPVILGGSRVAGVGPRQVSEIGSDSVEQTLWNGPIMHFLGPKSFFSRDGSKARDKRDLILDSWRGEAAANYKALFEAETVI